MTKASIVKLPAEPPGVPVQNISQVVNEGVIHFKAGNTNNSSLSPINGVTFNYNEKDPSQSTIGISVFFMVDQALYEKYINNSLVFTVYQYFCLGNEGQPQLQFYITSNYQNGNTDIYNYGQLQFLVTNDSLKSIGLTVADIFSIQTFMWDLDPKTSRGTITTVLHAI